MRVRQWKAKCVVIKLAVGPFRDGMASRAGRGSRGKTSGDVIRDTSTEGRCSVPRIQMAAHAIRGLQRVVVVDVAGSAGRGRWRGMSSRQSEPRYAVVE